VNRVSNFGLQSRGWTLYLGPYGLLYCYNFSQLSSPKQNWKLTGISLYPAVDDGCLYGVADMMDILMVSDDDLTEEVGQPK